MKATGQNHVQGETSLVQDETSLSGINQSGDYVLALGLGNLLNDLFLIKLTLISFWSIPVYFTSLLLGLKSVLLHVLYQDPHTSFQFFFSPF